MEMFSAISNVVAEPMDFRTTASGLISPQVSPLTNRTNARDIRTGNVLEMKARLSRGAFGSPTVLE